MRSINSLICVLFVLCVLNTRADDFQWLLSKSARDLKVRVWLHTERDMSFSITTPINYEFVTVTNKNCVVELPKDEFICSAQMLDSKGNAVPLSTQCAKFGKRFHELVYPSVEQKWDNALRNVLRMKPAHSTGPSLGFGQQMEADFVIATQDGSSEHSLPSVEELFAPEIPGEYKISLQFQAYARIYKGGQSFAYKLERFEPIEFTVKKEKR